MVFFTCNACGESLKKGQVDKHASMCRGCQVLSCIDCGKDFWGDDYKNHNKCISEDQKYGGKGFEAKANKGDVKQQQWIQRVSDAMNKPGVNAKLRSVLQQVCAYDNVPRKKAKFQNWMRNSLKIGNPAIQEEVWDIIAAADSPPEAPKDNKQGKQTEVTEVKMDTNGNEEQHAEADTKKKKLNKRERKEARQQGNGKAGKAAEKMAAQEPEEEQMGTKKKKQKKRKHDREENGDEVVGSDSEKSAKRMKSNDEEETDMNGSVAAEDNDTPQGKFNWKGNIKAVLRDSPDQELSLKKLRKKVVAAYYSFAGDGNFKSEEEVLVLFNKKVNNNPKFRVLKEKVRLVK